MTYDEAHQFLEGLRNFEIDMTAFIAKKIEEYGLPDDDDLAFDIDKAIDNYFQDIRSNAKIIIGEGGGEDEYASERFGHNQYGLK